MKYAPVELSYRDKSMVLAALRLWQKVYSFENVKEEFFDIATDDGAHTLMTPDEIDNLCEGINCGHLKISDLDSAEKLADIRALREQRLDVLHRAGLLEGEAESLKGDIEDMTGKPEITAEQAEKLRLLIIERDAAVAARKCAMPGGWITVDQIALDRIEAKITDIAGDWQR